MIKNFIFLFSLSLFANLAYSQDEYAWLYFTDKKNVNYLINNPHLILSPKSIQKKTNKGITIDSRDVPINEDYVNTIKFQDEILVLAKSKWFNCLYVKGPLERLEDLSQLEFIDYIVYANKSLNSNRFHVNSSNVEFNYSEEFTDYGSSANQINMLNLEFLHNKGFTAENIDIAIMDAGFKNVNIMSSFSRMRDRGAIKYTFDFVLRDQNIYNYQGNSHGTKVLSTLAGYIENQFIGSAPDASFYLFRTEDVSSESPVEESYWVEAIELADSLGVDITNTSLGYKSYDNSNYSHLNTDLDGYTTFITKASNIAFSKGILLVNSAGNSSSSGVIAPADSPNVVSVGAVDENGDYAPFSSQGSNIQPSLKPDLVAQGFQSKVINTNDEIVSSNGTSFSSPILAGGIACLVQAFPRIPSSDIIQIIKESSSKFTSPDYFMGNGIPNFSQAYELCLSLEQSNFLIFPNPVSDKINFISPWNVNKFEIEIFNINGKKIYFKSMINSRNSLDLSEMSNGIYFLKITYQNNNFEESSIKKIIKY